MTGVAVFILTEFSVINVKFDDPNVGKSSILGNITKSKPEVANYAFTTKKLNIGYIGKREEKIQIIDAPGALDRDNMNWIEQQADLAVHFVTDILIFVLVHSFWIMFY